MTDALKKAIERRNAVQAALMVLKDVQRQQRPLSRVQRAALVTVIALLKAVLKDRDHMVEIEKLYDPIYWS